MFMGVSLSKRRRVSAFTHHLPLSSHSLFLSQATEESSSNSGSLFSDVTNRGGGSGNSSQGAKRSFSSVISRRQSLNSVGGSAITVSSSQFVFLEDSSRTVNSSHHGKPLSFIPVCSALTCRRRPRRLLRHGGLTLSADLRWRLSQTANPFRGKLFRRRTEEIQDAPLWRQR
jgi:hypothetical protein